jgi:hypothetical protein
MQREFISGERSASNVAQHPTVRIDAATINAEVAIAERRSAGGPEMASIRTI